MTSDSEIQTIQQVYALAEIWASLIVAELDRDEREVLAEYLRDRGGAALHNLVDPPSDLGVTAVIEKASRIPGATCVIQDILELVPE